MTRRAGPRFDPFLTSYIATLREVLSPLTQRTTLDIAAGSGWVRQLGFERYVGLDLTPPHEIWDIDDPLPRHHEGGYELVLCLGAIHYAFDPQRSLREFRRALVADGDLVLMAPWLYPPHDRDIDRWRIAPRQLYAMLAPHFERVDLFLVGNVAQVPLHVAKRLIAGPFAGTDEAVLASVPARTAAPRLAVGRIDDVPTSWFGPLNVVAHASGHRPAADHGDPRTSHDHDPGRRP